MPCTGCILVVDDDSDIREALADFLTELGCVPALACDGLHALERLRDGPRPCLALVDLNMPRLDGEGFARCVRSNLDSCDVPIISMSAGVAQLVPPLVQSHLVKPIDLDRLAMTISRLCVKPATA